MKKRGMILAVFFLFFILTSFVVQAQEESGMLALFSNLGKFLFEDLPTLGDFGFKFLFWLALFALFNYGLRIRNMLDNRTAGIVAFVISLLTVILIPGETIAFLMRSYAIIIIFVFGVFIPVLLVVAVRRGITGDGLGERLARAVVYFAVAAALFNFTIYIKLSQIIVGIT